MRKEARILGLDDAPFDREKDKETLVIGTIFRGGDFLDGLVSCKIRIDGDDATQNISDMINRCRFKSHLRVIMTDGIAVGGFNVIDIEKLYHKTGIPIIVVIRTRPDILKIKNTLKKLDMEHKTRLLDKAGTIFAVNDIFFQICGLDQSLARDFLNLSCTRSSIPEPIRTAHIIGSGIKFGESRGRA